MSGMDLDVPAGPGLPLGLHVPAGLLVERFSRSPGPGGQSVNTTDSRVEVELALADLESLLTEAQSRRLRRALPDAVATGRLTALARDERSQHRNRVIARARLAEVVRSALAPPPPARRATRPTKGSQERRLRAKRQRAETKASRSRPATDG
ncbi:MAG: aminoacyl-tRNA hydrolase [Actinobacteria bacterium]|jgi:ribosome-associated protein|nr:aminoacyl-tRNA hydrolase [Actinomycetota bacterium]